MTFGEWVEASVERYQSQSPTTATRESARELLRGVNRRTADRWLGQTWWERSPDWDVLVILDGLRVDLARETIDEDITGVWSPASTSIDWIERHFDRTHAHHWRNTGYVTANPFADHDRPDVRSADLTEKNLGYLDLVYERAFGDVNGIKTTPPEAVTDAAIHAGRNADVDRLIVHYMQPHQPFRSRADWESVFSNLENLAGEVNQGGPCIWQRARAGEIPRDELWQAYRDNLNWVYEDVQDRLLENIDGDVVVTADHGNGMGEWGTWAHPQGAITPQIRKVPAWTTTATDNETVTPSLTAEQDTTTVDDVDTQLEALGYK